MYSIHAPDHEVIQLRVDMHPWYVLKVEKLLEDVRAQIEKGPTKAPDTTANSRYQCHSCARVIREPPVWYCIECHGQCRGHISHSQNLMRPTDEFKTRTFVCTTCNDNDENERRWWDKTHHSATPMGEAAEAEHRWWHALVLCQPAAQSAESRLESDLQAIRRTLRDLEDRILAPARDEGEGKRRNSTFQEQVSVVEEADPLQTS